uniref:Helicase n=1 Tax=Syphacia muris TaxID=451379 RepID=A0A158R5G4_9BILA
MDENSQMIKMDKKAITKLKEEVAVKLKQELLKEIDDRFKQELGNEQWIRRSEIMDIISSFMEMLCAEFDELLVSKVDHCLQKLRQKIALDSDEAIDIVNKWKQESQNNCKRKVINELCEQLTERERRSKDRWMKAIGNLKHYVVEMDDGYESESWEQDKFPIIEDLLNRFKNRLVIVFMKANDEVEDLLCSVHRRERFQMVEYLLPGLTRKNSITNVMGGNVRITFARSDLAYEFHVKPNEEVIIINYDFYTRTKTYMHRLRLAGFSGIPKGIVINLVEQSQLEYLGNIECHYDLVMEPLSEDISLFST